MITTTIAPDIDDLEETLFDTTVKPAIIEDELFETTISTTTSTETPIEVITTTEMATKINATTQAAVSGILRITVKLLIRLAL